MRHRMRTNNRKSGIYLLLPVLVIGFLGVLALPARGETGAPVPDEGLRAEMRGEWHKAVRIYHNVLKVEPHRWELWIRIADIEAFLKNRDKVIDALVRAGRLKPDKDIIFFKLSQAYSLLGRPVESLEAIERASKIAPDNITYLQARAQLANWLGKPKVAADSYVRLMKLVPEDKELLLYAARADSWSGRLDRSVAFYREYLGFFPDQLMVMNEYIRVETWRGNYAGAMKLVNRFREKGGDEKIYLQRRADVLCRGSRPRKGLREVARALRQDPWNYELNTARTIALHYDNQPREAVDSLELLESLRPDSMDTRRLNQFVRTPLRHSVPLGGRYYVDSMDITLFSLGIDGGVQLNHRLRLAGGYSRNLLSAPITSGFNNINGQENALLQRQWLGLNLRLNRVVNLNGYVGSEKAEEMDPIFVYSIAGRFRMGDHLSLDLRQNHGYFMVSPRSVSLGIEMTSNFANLHWEPDFRWVFPLYAWYDSFSDDNSRWQVILAPRYLLRRAARLNLDIGIKGWWFGYKDTLSNGYWSPEYFQGYMGTLGGYWKMGRNDGLDFRVEAGFIKFDDMDRFRFGYSFDLQGSFGIFRDLLLKPRFYYLHNVFQPSGAFYAYLFALSLELRL